MQRSPVTVPADRPRGRFRRWAFLPFAALALAVAALTLFQGADPAWASTGDRPSSMWSPNCYVEAGFTNLVELTPTGSGDMKTVTTTSLASNHRVFQSGCRSGRDHVGYSYSVVTGNRIDGYTVRRERADIYHFSRFYSFTLTEFKEVTINLGFSGSPPAAPQLNLWNRSYGSGDAKQPRFVGNNSRPPGQAHFLMEVPLATTEPPADMPRSTAGSTASISMELAPGDYIIEATTEQFVAAGEDLLGVGINLSLTTQTPARLQPAISGLNVTPGSDNLTVRWQLFPASHYRLDWKGPGEDYTPYARNAQISGSDFLHGGFKFNIPNLTRGQQYAVRVTPVKNGQAMFDAASEVTGTPGACFGPDLTAGTSVNSAWTESCTSPTVAYRGAPAYVRYFDFTIPGSDGRQAVTISATGS